MARGVKTGGRQKGTCNKVTKDLRQTIKDLLEQEFAKINSLLDNMDPKDRLSFIVKLLPYSIPRYDNIPLESEEEETTGPWSEYVRKALEQSCKAKSQES